MVGPKGRCSSSVQAWPTMTGLMNSGTIRIDMITPRPRKLLHHGERQGEAEQELDRDVGDRQDRRSASSDQRATGSSDDLREILQADEGVAGDLEVVVDEGDPERKQQRIDRQRQDEQARPARPAAI